MSYDLVKNGIVGLMQGLGYQESDEAVDFKNAPENEAGMTFILKNLKGEIDETCVDRFYDIQEWQVQIAFAKNAQNDLIIRDAMHRAKDTILITLDEPANWTSFVKIMKYKSWAVVETPNYYILDVRLQVTDQYIYT